VSQSGSGQEAVLQIGKLSSAICLTFDQFETVDVSFHRSGTIRKRESGQDRLFVPLATLCKGEELPNRGGPYLFEPAIATLTAVVANAGPRSRGSALVLARG